METKTTVHVHGATTARVLEADADAVLSPTPAPLSPDPSGEAGSISRSRPGTEHDDEARRRSIARAMRIGLWVWPSFALLDAYMCLALYPEAPFLLYAAYRVALEAILYLVYRAALRPGFPVRRLVFLQNLAFFLAVLCCSLMTVHFGGTRSAYMHGISIVCLVRSAVIPEPWRACLLHFTAMGLACPAVMAITGALFPDLGAEWFSVPALGAFASNYVFVFASSLVGMASGHAVWAARQQVYRARRLGRYRLQAPIGKGGMGEVWLAWDGSLRRNVALKILRMDGPPDQESVRRFEREARSASRLRGPHTVAVHDFGASDDGIYYIAMEYLPGIDLDRLVRRHGRLPPARAVRFIEQACRSLEEAHEVGIIHRDVKPGNLLVTRVGDDWDFLKLLDFGIARFRAEDAAGTLALTRTGQLAGTPAYLAPEVWRGSRADERSDIYALGGTLYFLLAGEAPFEGKGVEDLLLAHLERPPVSPSARRGEALPEGLDGIVMRCLVKSPADRFQSVRELRDALAGVRDPSGWSAEDAREFWRKAAVPAIDDWRRDGS